MVTDLLILVFTGGGAVIFMLGALKMFSRVQKKVEAVGGLEGLKAARLRMTEEYPAAVLPITTPVGRVETTRLMWLIFALSALLCFGVGGFFQYRAMRSARLLENEGFVTTAVVTAKSIFEGDEGDETFYVSYTFDASSAGGGSQAIRRKESVPYALYREIEPGEEIDVIYASGDPKVARIMANYEPGKVSYLPIFVGGIMGLVALLLAIPLYRRFRNAVRLDVEGVSATTPVLDLFVTSGEGDASYYVAYTLPDGQKIRHTVSAEIYKRLHVGDLIRVVYLSDNLKIFRPEWGEF